VGVELEVKEPVEEMGGEKLVRRAHSSAWQGTGQGDAYPFHTPARSENGSEQERENEQEGFGSVEISATVSCDGKTGVEMEALTAASTAALTVYDMCKAVDKGMRIEGLRVVRKEGGTSGVWVEGEAVEDGEGDVPKIRRYEYNKNG